MSTLSLLFLQSFEGTPLTDYSTDLLRTLALSGVIRLALSPIGIPLEAYFLVACIGVWFHNVFHTCFFETSPLSNWLLPILDPTLLLRNKISHGFTA